MTSITQRSTGSPRHHPPTSTTHQPHSWSVSGIHPTDYRGDQWSNILDVILTNEEGMLSNITQTASLGKSHHVCVHFNLNCYTDAPEQKTQRHLYHKGDYDLMWEEARALSWYDTDREDVDQNGNFLQITSKHRLKNTSPKSICSGHQGREIEETTPGYS